MLLLCQAVERQAAAGVAEADSLLLVVDGQEGLTAADEEIISWLRRKHPDKPVTLAVNKCENVRLADTQVTHLYLQLLSAWALFTSCGRHQPCGNTIGQEDS